MADRIPLVTQPAKDNIPKVWNDGRWADAASTNIVITDPDGKIPEAQLPEAALTANVPDWKQQRDWLKDDLCYRDNKMYRANGDMPYDTPFVVGILSTHWHELTTASEVSNIPDWDEYNPFLDKIIKKGDLFYYRTDLYRAAIANTGKAISELNYFVKLTGFKQAPAFSSNLSYDANAVVMFAGIVAQANADIVAGTAFAWGTGNTPTFRPVLNPGRYQPVWRGVVPATNTNYGFGDVIALFDTDMSLSMCVVQTTQTLNASNNIVLDRRIWIPLIGGVPAYALSDYVSKQDDIVAKGFDMANQYETGTLVIYGLAENVWVCTKKVLPGNIFNAGKEWVRINDFTAPISNAFGRQTKSYVKPVNSPKEYYDVDLKIMMLHRPDDSFAQYDGIKETITFPTSPTNGQTFTTTVSGTVYQYDGTKYYWKLNSVGASGTGRSMGLFTRNVEQTGIAATGTVWSLDTTNQISGTNITRNGGTITLAGKRTYKITFKVDLANLTASQWARYGVYNVTTSSWQPNQSYSASWMAGSSGYLPNNMGLVFIDANVDTQIQIRNIYISGGTHSIRGSLDTSNDAGDSYILVEEVSGTDVIDNRKTVVLEGERTDYLMAKLSTNLSAGGASVAFDLPFNSNVVSIGEVVNTSGVFRLKANKTYELVCDVFTSISGSGRVAYAWHDSNNVRLQGTYGGKAAVSSVENFATQSIARTVITPSVDMDVKVRVTYDTGGGHTIYADDSTLGSSYAIIKQLGSTKVTTSEIVSSPNDPKNYWTRDVINNTYDVSKHITDWYFATFISDLSSMAVALKVGESAAEKQARAWYLLQKFNLYFQGTGDNDNTFDGLLGEAGRVMNTVPTMMNAGRFGGNAIPGMGLGDVDQALSGGAGTTFTLTGTPTEYYKLCLGRDNANNIHFITVTPYTYWNTSTQTALPALVIGLAFWNGSAWAYPGGGGAIPVYSATSFVSTGTQTQSNNVCNASAPVAQYLPHRLELA